MSDKDNGQDRNDGRDRKAADPAGEARRVLAVVEATVLASRRRPTREEHRQRFADTVKGMFADD